MFLCLGVTGSFCCCPWSFCDQLLVVVVVVVVVVVARHSEHPTNISWRELFGLGYVVLVESHQNPEVSHKVTKPQQQQQQHPKLTTRHSLVVLVWFLDFSFFLSPLAVLACPGPLAVVILASNNTKATPTPAEKKCQDSITMTRILSTYLLVVLLVLWEGRTDAFQSLTNAAASIGTTTATRNDGPTLPTTETSVVTAVGQSRRNIFGVAIAAIGVGIGGSPALAERSLGSVTESYKRYVPRMEAGFAFLGTDLKEMIENQDKAGVVAELTAEKGTKISAMKGTMKVRRCFAP